MSLDEFVAKEAEQKNQYEQAPAVPQFDTFYMNGNALSTFFTERDFLNIQILLHGMG